MNIPLITSWITGISNGYQHKDGGIPASNKYGILSISSGLLMAKAFGEQPLPITRPGTILSGLFLGAPLVIGTTFYLGHLLGKSIPRSDN